MGVGGVRLVWKYGGWGGGRRDERELDVGTGCRDNKKKLGFRG